MISLLEILDELEINRPQSKLDKIKEHFVVFLEDLYGGATEYDDSFINNAPNLSELMRLMEDELEPQNALSQLVIALTENKIV